MIIGILQCDQIHHQLIAQHGYYVEMFVKLFHQIDPSIEFQLYDVEQGQFPDTIDAADAYLITGSRHGVNDGFAWINALEDYVRQLHSMQKKIIGICFGHQLIAKALGGTVIKAPQGWQVGISTNRLVQKKAWISPHLEEFKLLVSHQDQVVKLPPGAELLAQNDFCPFYMLQIADTIFSVQGHPEFTKSYSRSLIETRETILGKERFEQGLNSLKEEPDNTLLAQWLINFLQIIRM